MRPGGSAAALWTAYAFVVLQLAYVSTLFGGLPDIARAVLAALALTLVAGLVLNLLQRRLAVVAAAGAVLLLLIAQVTVFARLSGYPINWNILFSYVAIASFAVFTPLSPSQLDRVLRLLFVVSLVYCILYVALAIGLVRLPGLKTLDDEMRGTRLFLSTAHAAYCLFYGIARIRQRERILLWLLPTLIAAAAIGLAFSRVFILLLGIVVLVLLLVGTSKPIRQAFCAALLTIVGVLLVGIVAPGFNLFEPLSTDPSGAARATAYGVLRNLLAENWLLGIGLASEARDFAAFVGQPYVFWEDVGGLGVWSTFGLVGLAAFVGLAVLCILGVSRPKELDEARYAALSWSGILAGLTAVHSPDLLGGSAAAIVGMLIALAGRASAEQEQVPHVQSNSGAGTDLVEGRALKLLFSRRNGRSTKR